ncbi:putative amidase [Martiniozyma asiatica (nom. inval.)]|nr:putative amidase [Martiniozyma asiatica]
MTRENIDYQQVVAEKSQSLLNNIPSEWRLKEIPSPETTPNVNDFLDSFLPQEEVEIVNKSAAELLELQSKGELTATQICNAYCHRSAYVHQLTNCCTEIFYDRAFKSAAALDKHFKETGQLKGKMHGIPVSLKDQVNLPGITTAIGYVAPHISTEFEKIITHRKSHDDKSLIAEILEQEGAIFYVKTTVPMAMLAGETASNLGVTLNSLDRRNAPGGSSGGEGALIGGKGSIIGLGTDIGGSIRAPCAVHGLYGLRACSNRFTYLDVANSYPNQVGVCSVIGPMSRFAKDLALISEVILNHPLCEKDPKWIPINWRSDLYNSALNDDLRIGFMKWDGEIMPQPPILNKIDALKNLLSNMDSFECIDINKPGVPYGSLVKVLLNLYLTDDFEEIKKFCALSGEPLSELLVRCFTRSGHVDTAPEFFDNCRLKYEYQQQMDNWWNNLANENGKQLDCIITPTFAAPGWTNGDVNNIANFYTRALNVLDYTAVTLPVGFVDENDDTWVRENFQTEQDQRVWNYYNKEKLLGKPVVLQLVCKRYQEEKAIALVQRLSALINSN